jgi:hypothetical protein
LWYPKTRFCWESDIDERQDILAGQQRRPAGQLSQELPVHRLQLAGVPPGERAQERPQGGRCPHPAKQERHRAMPQQVHVIDTVRPGRHSRDQAAHLRARVHPGRAADPDIPGGKLRQPAAPRQGHHRDQPGPRHQIRVIKGRMCLRQIM